MGASLAATGLDLLALHERFPARYPVLLESVSGAAELGRHDLLFALPGERLTSTADGTLEGHVPDARSGSRFLDALDAWYQCETSGLYRSHADEPLFAGGWFLYLGYELAAEIEPSLQLPRSELPRAVAWRTRGAVLRDRVTNEWRAVAETPALTQSLELQVARDLAELRGAPLRQAPSALADDVREQDPHVFLRGVADVLDAIAARRGLPGQPVAVLARAPCPGRHGDRRVPSLAAGQSRPVRCHCGTR